jgi:hypothetical protein
MGKTKEERQKSRKIVETNVQREKIRYIGAFNYI